MESEINCPQAMHAPCLIIIYSPAALFCREIASNFNTELTVLLHSIHDIHWRVQHNMEPIYCSSLASSLEIKQEQLWAFVTVNNEILRSKLAQTWNEWMAGSNLRVTFIHFISYCPNGQFRCQVGMHTNGVCLCMIVQLNFVHGSRVHRQ